MKTRTAKEVHVSIEAPKVDDAPQLRSLKDAALRLDVCVRTLKREINRGNIRAVRLGKAGIRISEAEIRRLVEQGSRPLD